MSGWCDGAAWAASGAQFAPQETHAKLVDGTEDGGGWLTLSLFDEAPRGVAGQPPLDQRAADLEISRSRMIERLALAHCRDDWTGPEAIDVTVAGGGSVASHQGR